MKGLQILLQSLGIRIEPAEIEGAWERTKDAIPKLGSAIEENNKRLASIDERLGAIERRFAAAQEYSGAQTVLEIFPPKKM